MVRPIAFVTSVVAFALLGAACGSNSTPTAPSPPAVSITEVFDGTLTPNGARTHSFSPTRGGTVSAQLTALEPDTEAVVGLALGTWNGQVCQIILANDASIQGTTVIGQAQTPGDFCVRLSDSAGTLTRPHTYEIAVTYFVNP